MDFKSIFQACNAELSADRVIRMLNLNVQNGYVSCPAHNDEHPSARLFDDGWMCYACNTQGDLVDYVAKHEGIKAWDALKMVDNYYSIGLLNGKNVKTRIVPREKPSKIFREWYENSILLLSCFLRIMRKLYPLIEADEVRYYVESQGQHIGLILDRMQILSPEESYEELRGEIEYYVRKFEGCKTGQDIVYRLGRSEILSRYSENEV